MSLDVAETVSGIHREIAAEGCFKTLVLEFAVTSIWEDTPGSLSGMERRAARPVPSFLQLAVAVACLAAEAVNSFPSTQYFFAWP